MAKRSKRRGARLPVPDAQRGKPTIDLPEGVTKDDIVHILYGYLTEGEFNRLGGPNPREYTWRLHVDMYWNRFDFTKKADWQAKEVMPEVPQYVDRFAAAMREAMMSNPEDFYAIKSPFDPEDDLEQAIRKMLGVWLSRCGRDALGHPIAFDVIFEEQMKLGALMMCAAVVTWKGDAEDGYPAVDSLDPRTLWLDNSGRNLYRIRRYEIDHTQLMELAQMTDEAGDPLYDIQQLEALTAGILLKMRWDKMQLSGTGQFDESTRHTVVIDEYLCNLIGFDGKLIAKNVLCVVANQRYLIRGPEKNPFWHRGDWLVAKPLVTAPLSPYGRAYVENITRIAATFNELTNLILDGTFTTAMKAFVADPNALEDPTQIDEGIWPNKIFKLGDGNKAAEFMKEIDMGQLPAQAVQVWQILKAELQEGAMFSELSLGQFAPKGRTSASEIQSVQTNSSSMMKSIARNAEVFVETVLTLVWQTGLQHMPAHDEVMEQVVGKAMYQTIYARRKEFASAPITFQVRGISEKINRVQKLQALMNMLQVVAQNPQLMQAFMQRINVDNLLNELFELFDVDPTELEPSDRQRMIQELTQRVQQALAMQQQQQAQPGAAPGATPTLPTPGSTGPSAAANPQQMLPPAAGG